MLTKKVLLDATNSRIYFSEEAPIYVDNNFNSDDFSDWVNSNYSASEIFGANEEFKKEIKKRFQEEMMEDAIYNGELFELMIETNGDYLKIDLMEP